MRLALNYSPQAAALVRAGAIAIDLFKCPPWPDLVRFARLEKPVYIHFSLRAAGGNGSIIDNGVKLPVNWAEVERWLAITGTHYVNLHLDPTTSEHPGIPQNSVAPEHVATMMAALVQDVQEAVAHWGTDRVIAENNHGNNNKSPRASILPNVIRQVVETTGCGFLLDISHARLAARRLGMDERAYIAQLPLAQLRELHLTGIQYVGDYWVERLRANGVEAERIAHYEGRWLDHLPLTDEDWLFMAWVAEQLRSGQWPRPDIIAVECGGIGPVWQAFSDSEALAAQIPRLRALFDFSES